MGFLKDTGATLKYPEYKGFANDLKKDGIIQFLNLYKKFKDSETSSQLWGDELEYHIVNIDPDTGNVRLRLVSGDTIGRIKSDIFDAQFEYGGWMIEGVPKQPFDIVCDPSPVLNNIRERREEIQKNLGPNDFVLPTAVFCLLGVGDYFIPSEAEKSETAFGKINGAVTMNGESKSNEVVENGATNSIKEEEEIKKEVLSEEKAVKRKIRTPEEKIANNVYSASRFADDEIITGHPRFPTLTYNLRTRREEKMCIKVPIYKDVNTSLEVTEDEPYPGFIYMDAMAFGMGNCCLQQTFATRNISHARYLTDQLAVIAPIMVIRCFWEKFNKFE